MAKTVCKILGVVLVVAGIAGFLKNDLGGMHLTAIHNVVHLVTAAIALYVGFKGTDSQARLFNQVFGVVYLLLGILGFVAPNVVTTIIQQHGGGSLTADSVVHLLIGVVCVVVGFMRSPQPAATT